jgi:hypothetical protein
MAIGFDELEEVVEVVVAYVGVDKSLALGIHEADVHGACMQIDSAVEFGGGLIEFHNDHSMWDREVPG